MSAETTLVSVLEQSAAVDALIHKRIFPDIVPMGEEIPAMSYVRTDTEFVRTIHSAAPIGSTASFELTCVATTRADADALADAVELALSAGGFQVMNRSAAVDLETDLWAAILSASFNA